MFFLAVLPSRDALTAIADRNCHEWHRTQGTPQQKRIVPSFSAWSQECRQESISFEVGKVSITASFGALEGSLDVHTVFDVIYPLGDNKAVAPRIPHPHAVQAASRMQ